MLMWIMLCSTHRYHGVASLSTEEQLQEQGEAAGRSAAIRDHKSLAQECYLDKETLRACETGVFIRTFKTPEEAVWTISILLENLQLLSKHHDAARIFDKVGLTPYFSLPTMGARCQKILSIIEYPN